MKSKCVLIFIAGVSVSLATYAFFGQMMKQGQQMMQMPMQMMQPPAQQNCRCDDKQ